MDAADTGANSTGRYGPEPSTVCGLAGRLMFLALLAGCVAGPPDRPVEPARSVVVPVHFATDRARSTPVAERVGYGGLRGDGSIDFGVAAVSIPPTHNPGGIEQPAWWRLEFTENPDRHVVILTATSLDRRSFIQNLNTSLGNGPERTALVFIHGYNVTFDDALRRTAQLTYDLGFPGASILYSWPSEGSPVSYTVDEANVAWTAEHLRRFLELVLTETGAEEVHVVAHSMGNRALVAALRALDWDSLPDGSARLDQVVLAAPDIDAGHFMQHAPALRDLAGRYTLYASSNDAALTASRGVHGYPRAGESGEDLLVIDGFDTIDASLVETDLVGHSYYGENRSVISDLFDLLHNDAPPSERRWLHPRSLGEFRYWQLQPLAGAAQLAR